MCKLLILLVIPAVLSRTIPTQQDNNILAKKFFDVLFRAVQANDYSILARNFVTKVYDQNQILIGEAPKELVFQILRQSLQSGSGGVPKGDMNIVRNNEKLSISVNVGSGGKAVFDVSILGQNQFILNNLSIFAPTTGFPTGLIKNII